MLRKSFIIFVDKICSGWWYILLVAEFCLLFHCVAIFKKWRRVHDARSNSLFGCWKKSRICHWKLVWTWSCCNAAIADCKMKQSSYKQNITLFIISLQFRGVLIFLWSYFFLNKAKSDLGVETLFTLLVIFCLLNIDPYFLFCIEYKSLTPQEENFLSVCSTIKFLRPFILQTSTYILVLTIPYRYKNSDI